MYFLLLYFFAFRVFFAAIVFRFQCIFCCYSFCDTIFYAALVLLGTLFLYCIFPAPRIPYSRVYHWKFKNRFALCNSTLFHWVGNYISFAIKFGFMGVLAPFFQYRWTMVGSASNLGGSGSIYRGCIGQKSSQNRVWERELYSPTS